MKKIAIVDENDNIIGSEEFEEARKDRFYRVSALWVTNSRGEVLLALRHRDKKHNPRTWGPAVSGTVEAGESYKENIIKESEEELGLANIIPKTGPKIKIKEEYKYFVQWFTLGIDRNIEEFMIQVDEVEEIKWFTKNELINGLREKPENFTPGVREGEKLFLQA